MKSWRSYFAKQFFKTAPTPKKKPLYPKSHSLELFFRSQSPPKRGLREVSNSGCVGMWIRVVDYTTISIRAEHAHVIGPCAYVRLYLNEIFGVSYMWMIYVNQSLMDWSSTRYYMILRKAYKIRDQQAGGCWVQGWSICL